ncbi:unnamed protein product [Owenia fusiformis]|uniref:Uncharacterized protein n=1 Tax=Owenia fusiformis TaxID=6347 RepID=A0A8J1TV16_OWEFU|nr:unnamed protein product [Owenia fusiformis]
MADSRERVEEAIANDIQHSDPVDVDDKIQSRLTMDDPQTAIDESDVPETPELSRKIEYEGDISSSECGSIRVVNKSLPPRRPLNYESDSSSDGGSMRLKGPKTPEMTRKVEEYFAAALEMHNLTDSEYETTGDGDEAVTLGRNAIQGILNSRNTEIACSEIDGYTTLTEEERKLIMKTMIEKLKADKEDDTMVSDDEQNHEEDISAMVESEEMTVNLNENADNLPESDQNLATTSSDDLSSNPSNNDAEVINESNKESACEVEEIIMDLSAQQVNVNDTAGGNAEAIMNISESSDTESIPQPQHDSGAELSSNVEEENKETLPVTSEVVYEVSQIVENTTLASDITDTDDKLNSKTGTRSVEKTKESSETMDTKIHKTDDERTLNGASNTADENTQNKIPETDATSSSDDEFQDTVEDISEESNNTKTSTSVNNIPSVNDETTNDIQTNASNIVNSDEVSDTIDENINDPVEEIEQLARDLDNNNLSDEAKDTVSESIQVKKQPYYSVSYDNKQDDTDQDQLPETTDIPIVDGTLKSDVVQNDAPTSKAETKRSVILTDQLSESSQKEMNNNTKRYEDSVLSKLDAKSLEQYKELEDKEANCVKQLKDMLCKGDTDLNYQAKILQRIGDIHLERGSLLKSPDSFINTAALYNAALVRHGDEYQEDKIRTALENLETIFLTQFAQRDSNLLEFDIDFSSFHMKMLQLIREHAQVEVRSITQLWDSEVDNDLESIRHREIIIAEKIRGLYSQITKDMTHFIRQLIFECFKTLGSAPCRYAILGCGDIARNEMTPFSDFEYGILLEEDGNIEEHREFFRNLARLFNMKMMSLGETVIPVLGITSLNRYDQHDNDWFYDTITPNGLRVSGNMPWEGRNPLGIRGASGRRSFELIKTPRELAFLQTQNNLRQNFETAKSLSTVSLLEGDEALFREYETTLAEFFTQMSGKNISSEAVARGQKLLYHEVDQYNMNLESSTFRTTGDLLEVKKEIYTLPSNILNSLKHIHRLVSKNPWDIIDEMLQKRLLNDEGAHNLKLATSISLFLRLRTYVHNEEKREVVDYQGSEEIDIASVLLGERQEILRRFYFTMQPLLTTLAYSRVSNEIPQLRHGIFYDDTHYSAGLANRKLFHYDKAIGHLENGLRNSTEEDAERYFLFHSSAVTYDQVGRHREAVVNYEHALELRHKIVGKPLGNLQIASTLCNLGYAFIRLRKAQQAITCLEESQEMIQQMKSHFPDANEACLSVDALSLNNLGLAYESLRNFQRSMEYYEDACRKYKDAFFFNSNLDIASNLDNLARIYGKLEYYIESIPFLEKALKIRKRVFGYDTARPEIVESLNNLGWTYQNLNNFPKAIAYYMQSLILTRQIYGTQSASPELAQTLHNLGRSYLSISNYDRSLVFFEEARDIYKKIYGNDRSSAEFAHLLGNLGAAYIGKGMHKKAMECFEQSLEADLKFFGVDTAQPNISLTLNNLGNLYFILSFYENALKCYEQSLSIIRNVHSMSECRPASYCLTLCQVVCVLLSMEKHQLAKQYGEDLKEEAAHLLDHQKANPELCMALSNVGYLHVCINETKDAILYYQLAHKLYVQVDSQDPSQKHDDDIMSCLDCLGDCFRVIGDTGGAIEKYQESLDMKTKLYGDEPNPEVAAVNSNIGDLHMGNHNFDKAKACFEETYKVCKKLYEGKPHPDVSSALSSLGFVHMMQGVNESALDYYQQSIDMSKSYYGEKSAHPDITSCLDSKGNVYETLGDNDNALACYAESLELKRYMYAGSYCADLDSSLKALARVCWAMQDYGKASAYQNEIVKLKQESEIHDKTEIQNAIDGPHDTIEIDTKQKLDDESHAVNGDTDIDDKEEKNGVNENGEDEPSESQC